MSHRDGHTEGLLKKKSQVQESLILELAGEVDLSCSIELRGLLMEALEAKPARLVLDLSEISFMDSSGLATLVEALQLSREQAISLRLAGLQPRVKSLFEIARLDQLFELYDTQKEALQ